MVIADIPGLIDGAAQGAGLGQRFLRHVERTRDLVYVLDGVAPDPWRVLDSVKAEVGAFSADLLQRPSLVVVNKVDLQGVRRLRSRSKAREVRFVSALTGEGVEDLSQRHRPPCGVRPGAAHPRDSRVTRLAERPRPDLVVERGRGGLSFGGAGRASRRANQPRLGDWAWALPGAARPPRRQRGPRGGGRATGDTVRIAGVEFEYQP